MRISEVELIGFKSFANRSRLVFDDRITCIVGPNGCGKSNVVDAIRWVMGEMSAKSLRGSAMADVIFNGTDNLKPLSMAQVSLIFSTDDGIVPPGYEGYQQIEIARRLFRTGESEYLINKQPARLRDIQEMLMDTGLGAKAYSIVEQGQIAKVLSSRPDERRALIEEAAGITKFKAKKDEALRKMDRTQSDLDRVQDVVSEIKRNVNSLARQAGKAKRYQVVKDELREVDLEVASRDYQRLSEQQKQVAGEMTQLKDLKSRTETDIETQEAELSQSQLDLVQVQKQVEEHRRRLSEINEQIRNAENERNVLERDVVNEGNKAQAFESELIRAEESIALHENTRDTEQVQGQEYVEKAKEKQQRLDELTAELNKRREVLKAKNSDTQDVRSRQMQLVQKVAQLESSLSGWNDRRAELLDQVSRQRSKGKDAEERILGLGDRVRVLQQNHAELLKERQELQVALEEKKARLGTLKEELHAQREAHESYKETFQNISVRLQSLSEMKRNMEGYREGVKKILTAAAKQNEAGGTVKGVMGVVADLVKVPEKFEAAFEAVLGERLQSVVVKDLDSGMEAADFLKDENVGRGSFVPSAPRRHGFTNYPEQTVRQSKGRLSDFVRFEDQYKPVFEHMLDGVLVVDNLDSAVNLHKANGYTGAFVTMEGEYLDPHGVITGGSREALASGILQMKREIAQLTSKAQEAKAAFEDARDRHLRSEGLIANVETQVRDLSRKLDDVGLLIREVESEVSRAQNEREALKEDLAELEARVLALKGHVTAGDGSVEERRKELDEARAELEMVRVTLSESEFGAQDLNREIEELNAKVAEARVDVSANRERGKAALERAEVSRRALVEAEERIARLREQIEQAGSKQVQCRERITEVTKKAETLTVMASKMAAVEADSRRQLDSYMEGVREKEKTQKMRRRDLDGINDQIGQVNMKAVELRLTVENLVTKILDKYDEHLPLVFDEYGQSELDNESLRIRQEELSDAIRKMGEVNLGAIEEYEESKQRYEFYITQQDDLLRAIDQLKQAIRKINKESRDRFVKTFEAVAAKFAEIIPMLFGGGKAQLTLTESEDVLDAGIEILVRPPGKKLQNMNLLSGGEKALTAIGMIFSIFLIKPSPFCLLDEVDAPLDDANIHRFNDLIEQMALHSQIIVITHNKRTMEKGDTLFGVTMEQKGVSKLVSVKMA